MFLYLGFKIFCFITFFKKSRSWRILLLFFYVSFIVWFCFVYFCFCRTSSKTKLFSYHLSQWFESVLFVELMIGLDFPPMLKIAWGTCSWVRTEDSQCPGVARLSAERWASTTSADSCWQETPITLGGQSSLWRSLWLFPGTSCQFPFRWWAWNNCLRH